MSNQPYDVAIIGGGIVGTATAMALLRDQSTSLVVLEAEANLAAHQTGNNSGVIHSGLYYRPGSLKAQNCVAGREAMYQFCEENDIPHDRCGKVVVATKEAELPALEELWRRGNVNGLKGLKKLTSEEIRDYEPHVAGIAGIHVPDTGIVNYTKVTEAFAEKINQGNGEIKTNARVEAFHSHANEFVLETTQGEVHCRNLINCAGLQSDRMARLCGAEPGLQIIPFRGEYYELNQDRWGLVKNLVYPVPDPRFPFLGVHFTRMIDGGVEAGPNAVLAFRREGYKRSSFSVKDAGQMFFSRGFWGIAGRYWKMGMGEFYRSFSKRSFVRALQQLIPEIQGSDVHRAGAGVRAQAVDPKDLLVDDFRIVERERMVHVLNAPSPAATASISIGQIIADMAARNFALN